MALIEMNALSTILCGSFSAKVFLPEMDKLQLNDKEDTEKYPVLWLFHSEGGTAMDWLCTPAEKCAAENGIFIIAADAQHSLCTNMVYGPKYEEFIANELPGICRNNLPISSKAEDNWIGGTGTGAYGAVKAALKHPDVFSACIAMDGIFDMDNICQKAINMEATGIFHNKESLNAVFGDIANIRESENDVYKLAEACKSGSFFITGAKDSVYNPEAKRLAQVLGEKAEYTGTKGAEADFTCRNTMREAVSWLCRKERNHG